MKCNVQAEVMQNRCKVEIHFDLTFDCCDCPLKPNQERYARERMDCVPNSISSRPSEISSKTVLEESSSSIRSWPTDTILT